LCSPILSPQIGACLRTLNPNPPRPSAPPSQSPQIGACLRTHCCSQQPTRGPKVSIPSNRGLPSDVLYENLKEDLKEVSIPSNRGLPSDSVHRLRRIGVQRRSQSPQIGACLRTCLSSAFLMDSSRVSIPSNRGLPSDRKYTSRWYGYIVRLNPLKSGPAFGPLQPSARRPSLSNRSQSPQIGACLRTFRVAALRSTTVRVSIPSNRGLPSDALFLTAEMGTGKVSIPSNRGLPSD